MRSLWIGLAIAPVAPSFAPAQAAGAAAEEHKIRMLDEQWLAAIAKRDAAATATFYAEDGAILPPDAPIAKGREAIANVWQGFFKLNGFHLTFAPTRLNVSSAADLAYEIGTYSVAFSGDNGPVKDEGKYVVAWKKVDGAWKVAADIFNSNGPHK
jgi:uncharacterized protein (TIGR02246 family)